jgi:hypothetical protein
MRDPDAIGRAKNYSKADSEEKESYQGCFPA